MSKWSSHVELREENGEVRAYKTNTTFNREIEIPSFPREGVDMQEWMGFMSLDALEAFRQFYTDKWTWDEDDERYRRVLDVVEPEIDKRADQVSLTPHQRAMAQQQGRVTFDLAHIRQMQDRRNG